jgi:hypothetical protein
MGLLDDAIREHLDLKRRRGADPAEVERAEREALGPVRRAPEAPPGGESGEAPAVFAYDREQDQESWSHDSSELTSELDSAIPELETVGPGGRDDDLLAFDEPEPPEPDLQAEHDDRADSRAGDETVEYDVDEGQDAEHSGERRGDDDVLEETPEFLQDTPDHDRLWFEQRPPKDFDFDG